VEVAVISAFATIQDIRAAHSDTAALEATPTPPPHRTKRAKAVVGPGTTGIHRASFRSVAIRTVRGVTRVPHRVSRAISGFDASGDFMGLVSFRTRWR
jgi:hypothetical protein